MGFAITITGSHLDGFTAAELSWTTADGEWLLGRVYERPEGWAVEIFSDEVSREVPLEALVVHLEKAREALLPYVNRVGLNPPDGLTPAGISLWLMTKSNGTAMGSQVKW